MSAAPTAPAKEPTTFAFSQDYLRRAEQIIAKYPPGRQASAVLPLLDLAQRQCGNWLPRAAMDYVAGILGMAPIRVYEVATFYSMFNLQPVGKWFLQICGTTPCWLRGSDDVIRTCESKLGIKMGETTADGKFTLKEVECLGACVNAPVVQVNDDFYEDLDAASMARLIDALAADQPPPKGSMTGRQNAAPVGGPQTLDGRAPGGDD
ncbi:MAG: NADH-quinone oxidoreductase subunit NuoE [Alphaproteobacteria bacterium]|nr:NADH-quinone oxidoreductase subunit NuoE [Alphaproteobacteria bacterium]